MMGKEKYLLDVKRAMFWHFSSSEIRETIEEFNSYFESARFSGLSEEEVMKQCGLPEKVAEELIGERDLVEKKRRRAVMAKGLLLAACVASIIICFSVFSFSIATNLFVLLCSIFIWFLAGNNCVVGVLEQTKAKTDAFVRGQLVLFMAVLFLHVCTLGIVPGILRTSSVMLAGNYIICGIYALITVFFFATIFFLKKMICGNIKMFFLAMQGISVICGLFLYIDFLKRIDTVMGAEFVFMPYLVCLIVLFFYGLLMKHRERN